MPHPIAYLSFDCHYRDTMPMPPAFWATCWGMLVDTFGTPWIVNDALIAI